MTEITEVYFYGIGEPLLRYNIVVEVATRPRSVFMHKVMLAVNTSGTFYRWNSNVDFAQHFDLVQVSLNAESEEKYNQICGPKFLGAYQTLMTFLCHLRNFINESCIPCRVELSIVDTSEEEYLPERERGHGLVPKPDHEACRQIADNCGWPLKVKKLIKDCELREWSQFPSTLKYDTLMSASEGVGSPDA